MSEKYDFNVNMVPCYIKDEKTGEFITVKNRNMIYAPSVSKNEVFGCVTPVYELVLHKDVVDIVKKNLIPDMGWKITEEKDHLFDNGGILFKMFIAESNYTVGDVKLHAAVSAVNSYNGKTKAGIHISLVDDSGTVMIPHTAKRMIYAFQGMVHKSGSVNMVVLKKLSKIIPAVVNDTVADWKLWEKDIIDPERLKILSQLFNYRLATHLVNLYSRSISRFELYKAISDYVLNKDNMAKSGYHYITKAGQLVKFMKNDYLFHCNNMNDLQSYIESKIKFSWEEKQKEKEENKNETPFIETNFKPETNSKIEEVEDESEEIGDILSMFN
jgi:hypothetical protein